MGTVEFEEKGQRPEKPDEVVMLTVEWRDDLPGTVVDGRAAFVTNTNQIARTLSI